MSVPSDLSGPLPDDPLFLLQEWLDHAVAELAAYNPTAMSLATVDHRGRAAARMVICRGYDPSQGWLVFYTDRGSAKGRELEAQPQAAAVFYWNALQRQVRLTGPVTIAPDSQTDAYFASRPVGAQLAAWASDQSAPLADRAELELRFRQVQERFGIESDEGGPADVPRPPAWIGYRLWVESVEFWAGRVHRLHDRARYERSLLPSDAGYTGSKWRATRLQP